MLSLAVKRVVSNWRNGLAETEVRNTGESNACASCDVGNAGVGDHPEKELANVGFDHALSDQCLKLAP